jgi:hypothetical protein
MQRLQAFFLVLLLASSACFAHKDRIVDIESDGTLSAIPEAFGPAALRITFSEANSGRPPVSSVELTLGARKTSLPACVTALLQTARPEDVRAMGSWYHDEKSLPYYLSVQFFDPGYRRQSDYHSGYSLLFNLRTARLMRMEVLIARNSGKALQSVPVDLAARCSPQELERFQDAWRPQAAAEAQPPMPDAAAAASGDIRGSVEGKSHDDDDRACSSRPS